MERGTAENILFYFIPFYSILFLVEQPQFEGTTVYLSDQQQWEDFGKGNECWKFYLQEM